ncbi:MAG: dCTP deaminase [Bdellovibrionales bacterium]
MILTGPQIAEEHAAGRIKLEPFIPAQVSQTSYDLTLGADVIRYTDPVLDPKKPPQYEKITMTADGLAMKAGDFLLGHSAETVGSDHFAAIVHGRSRVARMGLFVHVTSDLIHTGSHGHITFQLFATLPVTIYPGMQIGQVTFWVPKGEISLYRGKYHGAQGPKVSEIYKDFSDN